MPAKQAPIEPRRPPTLRPGTLREAVLSETIQGRDKRRFLLAGFLDEFYADPDGAAQRRRVEDEPPLTGDSKTDALIGAIGEHLCRRWALGDPPDWTNDARRFLHQPWFLGPERFKPFLLVESPGAYRRRFIFTEAEPLRRASMPHDGRWRYYETLRTGLAAESD